MSLEFCIGIVVGMIMTCILRRILSASGELKIDRSHPEKDLYKLEIDNLDVIPKKRYVILRVRPNSNLTQN